jgi:hypothetical protein
MGHAEVLIDRRRAKVFAVARLLSLDGAGSISDQ